MCSHVELKFRGKVPPSRWVEVTQKARACKTLNIVCIIGVLRNLTLYDSFINSYLRLASSSTAALHKFYYYYYYYYSAYVAYAMRCAIVFCEASGHPVITTIMRRRRLRLFDHTVRFPDVKNCKRCSSLSCRTREGIPPVHNWRRSQGRPPTWFHDTTSDTQHSASQACCRTVCPENARHDTAASASDGRWMILIVCWLSWCARRVHVGIIMR